MDVNKVLYITQEIAPYVPETALGAFARNISQSTQENGAEVRTFMPKYGNINERRNQLHEVIRLSGINIPIDDNDHPLLIKVATLQPSRLQVYFIDSDDFFMRNASGLLDTEHDAESNDERSIFFVRGTAETVKKLRWEPSVVHCIGWISSLAPLYLRTVFADDPVFVNTKIVFTLIGKGFDNNLNAEMVRKLKADGFTDEQLGALADGVDHDALARLAMDYADAITIGSDDVSPQLVEYARATGKPLLEYSADTTPQQYMELYKSLLHNNR